MPYRVASLDVDRDGFPDLVDPFAVDPGAATFSHPLARGGRTTGGTEVLEDCPVEITGRALFPTPPAPYDSQLPYLLHPRGALTLIGQWGHLAQGSSILWRGSDASVAGVNWAAARYEPSLGACVSQVPNAKHWRLTPIDTTPLLGVPGPMVLGGDVDGDGLVDGMLRTGELLLSRRTLLGGGASATRHIHAFETARPGPIVYTTYEPIPAVRGLVDMNGDGLADVIQTDRYTPNATPTFYGKYGPPSGPATTRFIERTRFTYDSLYPNPDCVGPCPPVSADASADPFLEPSVSNWLDSARLFATTAPPMGTVQVRSESELQGQATNTQGYIYGSGIDPLRPLHFADVNGDGFTDILVPHRTGGPGLQVAIYLNVGGVSLRRYCAADPTGALCDDSTDIRFGQEQDFRYGYRFMTVDLDASGVADLVLVTGSEVSAVSLVGQGLPGVLKAIDNGIGGHTTFNYQTYQVHMPGWPDVADDDKLEVVTPIVESMSVSNGLTGAAAHDATTHYRYRKPAFDTWAHAFRGFGEVTTLHPGGEATRDTYQFGACDQRAGCAATGDNDPTWVHAGKLVSSVELGEDPDGPGPAKRRVLQQTTYRYDLRPFAAETGRSGYYSYEKSVTVRLLDGLATRAPETRVVFEYPGAQRPPTTRVVETWSNDEQRLIYREQDVNDQGNVEFSRDYGEVKSDSPLVPKDSPIISQTTWVEPAPGLWRPSAQGVSDDGVSPTRWTSTTYDANGNPAHVEAYLAGSLPLMRYHETPGAAIARAPLGTPFAPTSPGWVRIATFTHDAVGNLKTRAGAPVHTVKGWTPVNWVSLEYDATYAHHVARKSVGLDGPASAAGRLLETSYLFDRGFGQTTEVNSPNFERTRIELDAFGRTIAVLDPSSDFPLATNAIPATTVRYESLAPISRIQTWTRNPNEPTSVGRRQLTYVDGLGFTRLHLGELDGGRWLASGAATRNARGQVTTTTSAAYPYAGGLDAPTLDLPSTATLVSQTYDTFGRASSTWEGPPSGISVGTRELSLTTYGPMKRTSYDANGLDTASLSHDSRLVSHLDGHGRVVETNTVTNSESADVFYDYLPTPPIYAPASFGDLDAAEAEVGGVELVHTNPPCRRRAKL